MGTDKALLQCRGRPLVELVAARLARVAEPVLLASGSPGRLPALGLREVADAVPEAGPLAGLASALEASPHRLIAAVAVDMPDLSPELLQMMAALWQDEDAVVPVTSRGPEPLHAVYSGEALPAVRAALEVDRSEWSTVDAGGEFALNINTEAELLARCGPSATAG
jgi:molybdopterin-guanine dinucleotide biosynthesis protein A